MRAAAHSSVHLASCSRRASERGAVLPLVLVAFPACALALLLVLDIGLSAVGREQLQSVADSAARGALTESTRSGRQGGTLLAQRLAREASVVGGGVELAPGLDVEWGTFDFRTSEFTRSTSLLAPPPQAVQVTARRSEGSVSGALRGLTGPIDASATAVASYRCRDVVLAQDASTSFQEEIDQAKRGLRELVDALALSSSGSTRVGLVAFQSRATVLLPLTPVPERAQSVTSAILSLSACPSLAACGGTNQGHAIDVALQMLAADPSSCDADPLIILVSDGVPCGPDGTTLSPPDPDLEPFGRIPGALERAAAARDQGVSVAPILLAVPGSPGCTTPQGPVATDPVFNAQLAGGFGEPLVTRRADELPETLLRTIGTFPIVLVR